MLFFTFNTKKSKSLLKTLNIDQSNSLKISNISTPSKSPRLSLPTDSSSIYLEPVSSKSILIKPSLPSRSPSSLKSPPPPPPLSYASKIMNVLKFNKFKNTNNKYQIDDIGKFKADDYYLDIANDYELYKITQNIRNGIKLTEFEIKYLSQLSRNDLLKVILLQNYCINVLTENIAGLQNEKTNIT